MDSLIRVLGVIRVKQRNGENQGRQRVFVRTGVQALSL